MATIVTKVLGVDVADINAFNALLPASLVAANEQWILAVPSASEFVFSTQQIITSHTTDATRNIVIQPVAGQGFADHAGALTNPYFYDPSKGAAIKSTYADISHSFFFTSAHTKVIGLQWETTGNGEVGLFCSGVSSLVEGNIIKFGALGANPALRLDSNSSIARSNLVIMPAVGATASLIDFSYGQFCSAIGNTMIGGGAGSGRGIAAEQADCIAKSNAIFGRATPMQGTLAANSSNNATDLATIGGTSNLTSLTQSDQFVSATDFRLKAGNALAGAGVAVSGWTTDGLKQALASPPQIGATKIVASSLTSVSADLAASYSILAVGQVSSSLAASYAIIAAVSSSLVASYSVAAATGSFVSDVWSRNTDSVWSSEDVVYTWVVNGRVGEFTGKTLVEDLTATTDVAGVLTVPGLPLGPGIMIGAVRGATYADDAVYMEPGVAS